MALGLNRKQDEGLGALLAQDKTIPVLQDTEEADVMARYAINKDDLITIDRSGKKFRQVSTQEYDLRTSEGVDSLTAWVRHLQ